MEKDLLLFDEIAKEIWYNYNSDKEIEIERFDSDEWFWHLRDEKIEIKKSIIELVCNTKFLEKFEHYLSLNKKIGELRREDFRLKLTYNLDNPVLYLHNLLFKK